MNYNDILRDNRVQAAALSAASTAGGIVIGYILAKRKYSKTYKVTVEETDVTDVQEDINQMKLDLEVPVDATTGLIAYDEVDQVVATEVTDDKNLINVFTVETTDWDYEIELQNRKPDEPYILHQEEFINDEMGFRQVTVTYYEGDDVMADENDTPIYNYAAIMGDLKFGHGTRDPNVVYIRNERLRMEWEVLRHTGHFRIEVEGMELEDEADRELRHSAAVPRFRARD